MSSNHGTTNATRRRLFKAVIGTGAALMAGHTLPEKWMQPVVEAVTLPAHAQATGMVFGGAGIIVSSELGMLTDPRTRFARLMDSALDLLVPKALALAPTSTVCAVQSGNFIDITIQRSQNNVRRQGVLNIDGTPGVLSPIAKSASCPETVASLNAYISGYIAGVGFGLVVTTGGGFELYLPLIGTCPGFAPLDGACPYE